MMINTLSAEEARLDARWRGLFGQPLPMLGAPDIARAILDRAEREDAGLEPRRAGRDV